MKKDKLSTIIYKVCKCIPRTKAEEKTIKKIIAEQEG